MNVAGWLPTDTVIGYAGLVWMGNILAALQGHRLYLFLIVGGVVWLLATALRGRGGLLDVGLHLLIALALLGFFGAGGVSIAQQPSFAERSGAQLAPDANGPPLDPVVVPRGFLAVTGALQDTVDALIPLINAEFVRNPFALLAATNSLMVASLEHDPALRARVADFLDQCYTPAITRWLRDHPGATAEAMRDVDTPLSDQLTPIYATLTLVPPDVGAGAAAPDTTCDAVWTPLKADLFTYADRYGAKSYMTVLGKHAQFFGVGQDTWLRNMLRIFRASHQPGSGFNAVTGAAEPGGSPGGQLGGFAAGLLAPLAYALNWAVVAQLVDLVRFATSPILGYVTAILYVAFPFVLAAAVLPGGLGRLVTYFALLGSVKAWPLVWAMVDRIYSAVLPSLSTFTTTASGAVDFYKPPVALNAVTGLMYILGPTMLSAALGIAGQQLGRGLSSFTTARLPISLLRG